MTDPAPEQEIQWEVAPAHTQNFVISKEGNLIAQIGQPELPFDERPVDE